MARLLALNFWRIPPSLGRTPGADYASLVWVLTRLWQIPDGEGRTTLTREEAELVRRCGFRARAGANWLCPPLPHRLVVDNPLLRHLSDRPDLLRNGRRASRWTRGSLPFLQLESRMSGTVYHAPGFCITRRELQQHYWRLGAPFFNYVMDRLAADGFYSVQR